MSAHNFQAGRGAHGVVLAFDDVAVVIVDVGGGVRRDMAVDVGVVRRRRVVLVVGVPDGSCCLEVALGCGVRNNSRGGGIMQHRRRCRCRWTWPQQVSCRLNGEKEVKGVT
jgi:hypothetical protein